MADSDSHDEEHIADPVEFGLEGPNASRLMMASMGARERLNTNDDDEEEEDYEDEDETLGERLIGLTEMLPEKVRDAAAKLLSNTWAGGKWLFQAGRITLWVVASSATVIALPVMFESERSQLEEQQLMQQRQIMLGPGAAMGGGGGLQPPLSHMSPPTR